MLLDSRGTRFSAWLTSIVLAGVLLTAGFSARTAGLIALGQALVFALGAYDARLAPYGRIFRGLLARHLGPPSDREPADPVRFSQAVGFVFLHVAAAGYLAGAPLLGVIATASALGAALLNAAFGLCLACKIYPFIRLYVLPRASVDAATTEGAST